MPRLDPSFLRLPIAHRGLHDLSDRRPENSRAAIQAAIAAGYGIEIDLQLTADGQAVVFHDYALDRLTAARGTVRLTSSTALAAIPLKGSAEGVPTLCEVLTLVAGRTPLLVEFKDQDGSMGPDLGGLETSAAPLIAAYNGPIAVMSFNPHAVIKLAELLPDVPRGIVTSAYRYHDWPLPKETCDRLREIPDYASAKASFVSHEVDDLISDPVKRMKEAGADILCWTVRSPEQEAQARQIADNITFEGYAAVRPT